MLLPKLPLPELPCITDKCLLLSVCRHKAHVCCTKLDEYYYNTQYLFKTPISESDLDILQIHVKNTFKNILTINPDNPRE